MKIVVKVGTSTLAHATGRFNIRRVEALCKVLSDIKNEGHDLILVSSGAIGLGVGKLNLTEKPRDMASKQAAAAIGQCELMYFYDAQFMKYNHIISQILITSMDFENQTSRQNFQNTVNRLLQFKVMPVINENDTIVTDEISVGDNDTLGAIVAKTLGADLLVILSDIDGFYTADPRIDEKARIIDSVTEITPEILTLAGSEGTRLGTGGMVTKIQAAKIAMEAGIPMVLANGKEPENLYRILDGEKVGTRFERK
ncbi:MAG: glutamate 5-kinase [Eubacterium sp.]|nr:glutamate 5-kinase [Eubacterium sp.]